jgi:transposase
MVTDTQIRRLRKLKHTKTLAQAAAMAGMDEKTARKYLKAGKLPSELVKPHTWRTRADPFASVWPQLESLLEQNAGLQAKTLFEWLRREHPGQFHPGQLRTLQRHVAAWRATRGPAQEVMFEQIHEPGRLAQSDFTHVDKLGVTIKGRPFPHMLYHFTLTCSNWEWASICFSESFESLAEGLIEALETLGAVPRVHQTDSLTAAVRRLDSPEDFTQRYQALLDHYRLQGQHTQPQKPNENGDIENRNGNLKTVVDQRLMLRGSRDFEARADYEVFLHQLMRELNTGREERLAQELKAMRRLPARPFDGCQRLDLSVSQGSIISVKKNIYSVHSRLIGKKLRAFIHAEHIDLYLGRAHVERLERLRGEGRYLINYRHVIDWLVRKPGAFERYRFRECLFPTSRFRVAYDLLVRKGRRSGQKQYLKILHLAATENETAVDECLRRMIDRGEPIELEQIKAFVEAQTKPAAPREVHVVDVDLNDYDALLAHNFGDLAQIGGSPSWL